MTTVSLKSMLTTLIDCENADSRLALSNEIIQALSSTIDKVSKEPRKEERKELLEHFEVKAGPSLEATVSNMSSKEREHSHRGPVSNTIFYPFVVPPEVKGIDPRDTIAQRVWGPKANNFFFTLYFRNQYTAATILTLAVLGGICILLGLAGLVQSEVSWGSAALTPFLFGFYAMLNRHLLHVLRREFDFWVLLILSSVSCASFLDMVWEDPQRIVAVVYLFLCSLALVASDARPVFRKKAYGYRLIFLGATLVYAFLLVLYTCNLWNNFRTTVYFIGLGRGIQFQVPSTGMGCATTLCVLTGKYAWVILRSKDINPLVVLRSSIVLRPFARGLVPNTDDAPHVVLRRHSILIDTAAPPKSIHSTDLVSATVTPENESEHSNGIRSYDV